MQLLYTLRRSKLARHIEPILLPEDKPEENPDAKPEVADCAVTVDCEL